MYLCWVSMGICLCGVINKEIEGFGAATEFLESGMKEVGSVGIHGREEVGLVEKDGNVWLAGGIPLLRSEKM